MPGNSITYQSLTSSNHFIGSAYREQFLAQPAEVIFYKLTIK